MSRAEKEKARPNEVASADPDGYLPPTALPRKHPLLLAIAVTLFVGWIVFLIVLAIRG